MIIFQRMATFQAPPDEVVPWALEMTELVNDRTELDTSLWQGLFGGPLGTLVWSTQVPSMTALETAMDTVAADSGYLQLARRAQDWLAAPPEDSLLQMVHSAGGDYVRPGVGAYAEATVAQPVAGKLAEATAWGIDISDYASKLTHTPILLCASAFGGFGELRWLGTFENAAAFDAAEEILAKDEEYVRRIDSGGPLFRPESAQRALARRIA